MIQRFLFLFCIGLLIVNFSSIDARAADGNADASFSSGTLFGNDVYALIIQPDGKILVGGDFGNASGTREGVARLNPDGTPDPDFIGSAASQVRAMALQPDGKILIGGYFTAVSGTPRVRIARLNADGTLDTTFNPGSGVTGFNTSLNAIAVEPGGKILIGGDFNFVNDVQRQNIARLNADGSVDATFNAGVVTSDFSGVITDIVFQTDNKILVGGYFNGIGGVSSKGIARLNANGDVDTTFNVGAGTGHGVNSVKLQPDNKILIGGYFATFNGVSRNRLARLNADGSLDTSFTPNISGMGINIYDTIVLPSGKIVVVGNFDTVDGEFCNRVCRLNPAGNIDRSFKSGTDDFVDYVFVAALQKDNKILIGGNFYNVRGKPRRNLARLINSTVSDFEGDGKTDISIFRPPTGEWWYLKSLNGENYAAQFGTSTDKLTPADFTGDGKTDIAFFRPATGEWFVLRSENGSFYSFPFGTAGDIPAVGDYDNDGFADAAVFRPSTATWYIMRSSGGTTIRQFGANGDVPVVADYDADGKADIAIYRTSNGEWWILKSSNGSTTAFQFGSSTDKPVQGDYTGDGKADVALWRPSTGEWFVLRSENQSYYSALFGANGDTPTPGDFDGDGKADLAIYRPAETNWYINKSTGGFLIRQFGAGGDIPVPSALVP
jgi:uncharacterized delta-60 repeat protein